MIQIGKIVSAWAFAVLLLGITSINAQPIITEQPTNKIVLNGGNVTFSVAATGIGLWSYQW